MKQIYLYSDGSKAVIDTDSPDAPKIVRVDSDEVVTVSTIVDATDENMATHFPDQVGAISGDVVIE